MSATLCVASPPLLPRLCARWRSLADGPALTALLVLLYLDSLSTTAPVPAARPPQPRRRPLLLPTSPSLFSSAPLARAPPPPSSGAREAQGAAEVDRGVQGAPRRAREEPRRARGEHRQEELSAVGVARGRLSSVSVCALGRRRSVRRKAARLDERRSSSSEEDEGDLNKGYHRGNSSSDFGSSLRCAAMLA